ncbi:MAG: hypothetical protein K6F07_01615 [Bacilli bacterium]|nr:hypothetical protein [Bacilli bacterium]
MKKRLLYFVPILLTVASLSACDLFSIPQASFLEATKIKYTYEDYAENYYFDISYCPTVGNPKLLVVPIWFNDSSLFISTLKKETVRGDIVTAYTGSKSETGWHSVATYYQEESLGQCNLTATVTDWYEVNDTYTAYATEKTGLNKTTALVETVSDWYFTNNPSDSRTNYDYNGDGYLDGVMLIYGAPDYGSLKNKNYSNLWAYCFWLYDASLKDTANPGPNAFFWASYDFMYGENVAFLRTGKSKYGYGDTKLVNVDTHTYIHEMGHVFGLQDYYDYSDDQYIPAGGFSMQDLNIGGHDPYSVMAYGWANPMVPTDSITLEIRPFQSSHDLVLLSPKFTGSPFDEYLLLEYYTPTGLNEMDVKYSYTDRYPQGPSSYGIRLWHIDARLVLIDSGDIISLTNNPVPGDGKTIMHAFSNSYNDEDYGSVLGKKYYDYNIIQLIRNDMKETYRPTDFISDYDLFYAGDKFTMSKYSEQFVKSTSLNSGNSLGWSFKVNAIEENKATVTFTKA